MSRGKRFIRHSVHEHLADIFCSHSLEELSRLRVCCQGDGRTPCHASRQGRPACQMLQIGASIPFPLRRRVHPYLVRREKEFASSHRPEHEWWPQSCQPHRVRDAPPRNVMDQVKGVESSAPRFFERPALPSRISHVDADLTPRDGLWNVVRHEYHPEPNIRTQLGQSCVNAPRFLWAGQENDIMPQPRDSFGGAPAIQGFTPSLRIASVSRNHDSHWRQPAIDVTSERNVRMVSGRPRMAITLCVAQKSRRMPSRNRHRALRSEAT